METYDQIYDNLHARLKGVWNAKDLRRMAAHIYARNFAQQFLLDAIKNLKQEQIQEAANIAINDHSAPDGYHYPNSAVIDLMRREYQHGYQHAIKQLQAETNKLNQSLTPTT